MRTILFILLIFVSSVVLSQTAAEYQKRIDELKAQKKNIQYQIKSLNNDLKNINEQIRVLEQNKSTIQPVFVSEDGIKAYVGETGGVLRRQPNVNGSIIVTLSPNEVIYVQNERHNLYLKVNYKGTYGYISYTSIKSNAEVDKLMTSNTATKTATTQVYSVDTSSPKYKRLSKIYGHEDAVRIINHKLWKGMSTGQIRESAGSPVSVSRENSPKGLLETWSYSDKTLKVLNGSLDSWKMK